MPDEQEAVQDRAAARRWTPLAIVLGLVAVGLLVLSHVLAGQHDAKVAAQQAEIEKSVKETNAQAAALAELQEKTRQLIDPLELLLATDKALESHGISPLSAHDFIERLAEADRKLAASPQLRGYIDTCRQREEIEKHQLYQGIHDPIRALPGWSKDWQTKCKSLLAPP